MLASTRLQFAPAVSFDLNAHRIAKLYISALETRNQDRVFRCGDDVLALYLQGMDLGLDALLAMQISEPLHHLNLSDTRVFDCPDQASFGSAQMLGMDTIIDALAQKAQIWKLNLSGTSLTDAGVRALGAASAVEVLYLNGTKITGNTLDALQNCPDLEDLRLEHTDLKPGQLKKLSGHLALKQLHLDHTPAGDDDIKALQSVPSLTCLNLNHTQVTDRCIDYLLKFPCLISVGLRATRVTEKARARLRKKLAQRTRAMTNEELHGPFGYQP
jgi:hypothetical protein